MLFTVKFVTYTGNYRTIDVDRLNVPTTDGRRGLVSNHMPIMLGLDIGVIEAGNGKDVSHYAISEGMLHFENNECTVLCDEIIDVADIDVSRAEKSLAKAEDKLKTATREKQILRAKIALSRAANLISASAKYGNRLN